MVQAKGLEAWQVLSSQSPVPQKIYIFKHKRSILKSWAVISKCLNLVYIHHLKQNWFFTYRGAELAREKGIPMTENLTDTISNQFWSFPRLKSLCHLTYRVSHRLDISFFFFSYHLYFPSFETNELFKVSRIIWGRKILTGILISLAHTKTNKCISLHYQDSSSKEQDVCKRMFTTKLFIIKVRLLMLFILGRKDYKMF
jgi:hypothetical protein